ncbi:endolytic transglycosylase MltG [Myceligenerans salitolerans]|uniref:Endolytic murein transglycosylase n=1 Tax=Myceligenerans salitolerans TaxID=1230528 RepID=A0ABS3IAS9_9MICO|nr:endolytic transglycosylase MltG [Myceligenerans salitolerans]MBO0610129.1 endolytic transglycosylase MltG [Myceligenerans salitolerans]
MTDLFTAPPDAHEGAPANTVHPGSRTPRDHRSRRLRRRRRRGRSIVVLLVTFGLVAGAGYLVWEQKDMLLSFENPIEAKDYPGPGNEDVTVEIPEGATGFDMAELLYDAGVVASKDAFVKAFGENPDAGGIRPGTRDMLTEMKASDAVALLAKNEMAHLAVTIPEGFTVAQTVERFASVTGIPAADFTKALDRPRSFGLPKQAGGNAEGWLYPQTYPVNPEEETAADVLARMVRNTVEQLDDRGIPPRDRQDVLIKASLVEREGMIAEDRPKIARAIENRLEDDMKLQIDASLAYGLDKPGIELTTADKAADTPFNLERHVGLPPTPIANPSAESIDAVLSPAEGAWKFWVTVNLDTGETKFSETYAEHQRYVAELREWQARQG